MEDAVPVRIHRYGFERIIVFRMITRYFGLSEVLVKQWSYGLRRPAHRIGDVFFRPRTKFRNKPKNLFGWLLASASSWCRKWLSQRWQSSRRTPIARQLLLGIAVCHAAHTNRVMRWKAITWLIRCCSLTDDCKRSLIRRWRRITSCLDNRRLLFRPFGAHHVDVDWHSTRKQCSYMEGEYPLAIIIHCKFDVQLKFSSFTNVISWSIDRELEPILNYLVYMFRCQFTTGSTLLGLIAWM